MTLWKTREAALKAKRLLDESACGGSCWNDHTITPMTLAEAKKCRSRWVWWAFGDSDDV